MTAAREELERLALACEQARGADRELDDAIATAIFRYAGMSQLVGVPDDGQFRTFSYANGSIGSSLRYTASLDAAMTLIPTHMLLHSLGETRHMKGGPWLAMLVEREQGAPHSGPHGAGATDALAVSAAALRAQVASS